MLPLVLALATFHAGTAGGSAGTSMRFGALLAGFCFASGSVSTATPSRESARVASGGRRGPSPAARRSRRLVLAFDLPPAGPAPPSPRSFPRTSCASSSASVASGSACSRHARAAAAAAGETPRRNLPTLKRDPLGATWSSALCADRTTAATIAGCAARYDLSSFAADGANSHVPASSARWRASDVPCRFSPTATSAGIASTPTRDTQSTTRPSPNTPSGSSSAEGGANPPSISRLDAQVSLSPAMLVARRPRRRDLAEPEKPAASISARACAFLRDRLARGERVHLMRKTV